MQNSMESNLSSPKEPRKRVPEDDLISASAVPTISITMPIAHLLLFLIGRKYSFICDEKAPRIINASQNGTSWKLYGSEILKYINTPVSVKRHNVVTITVTFDFRILSINQKKNRLDRKSAIRNQKSAR